MERDTKHEFLEPKQRAVPCEVRAVGGRVLTFTASTEKVARDGDIIEVSGWDTKEFMKNPVFLWAHDPSVPPIGKVTNVRKVRAKGEDRRLEVDVDFAGLEQSHELAESVYRLYRDGFMRAVSVGFRVRGYRKPDEDEREQLGLKEYGMVITAAELLEVSAVPVPADPGALLTSKAARADLVRMRDAASAEDRERWDALIEEPDMNEDIREEIASLRDDLMAEIGRLRDDLRLRALEAEPPPDSARDEPDSVDWYGAAEALAKHFNPKEVDS